MYFFIYVVCTHMYGVCEAIGKYLLYIFISTNMYTQKGKEKGEKTVVQDLDSLLKKYNYDPVKMIMHSLCTQKTKFMVGTVLVYPFLHMMDDLLLYLCVYLV